MKNPFCRLIHRHVWRPLRTEYRYRSNYKARGQMITVKKCQCRSCGKIDYFHFIGKELIY